MTKQVSSDQMTPEQLARFDAASNHPYECKCEICKECWDLCGPEREGDEEEGSGFSAETLEMLEDGEHEDYFGE